MTIALGGSKSGHFTASPITTFPALTFAPNVGDLLVAVLANAVSTNTWITVLAGWTEVVSVNSGSSTAIKVWMRLSDGTEGTTPLGSSIAYTGGNQVDIHLMRFTGLTTPTLDKVANANSGAGTVTSQATGTTAGLSGFGDLVLSAFYANTGLTTPTASPAGTSIEQTSRMLSTYSVASDQSPQSVTYSSASAASKMIAAIIAVSPDVLSSSGFSGWGHAA